MLLVIGADGDALDSMVSKRFGQASYYIVYNTDSGHFDAIKNTHVEDSDSEKGDEHGNLRDFLRRGIRTFIVGNIGPVAFEAIKSPETKVYLGRKMTVREAIKKFQNGELVELTAPTAKRSIGSHGKKK